MLLILLLSLIPLSHGSCDLECRTFENYPEKMTWTPHATGCENNLSDADCELNYGSANLTEGSTAGRPQQCYQMKNAQGVWEDSDTQKQGAIDLCPKTCGYCCVTSDFTCPMPEIMNVPKDIQKLCEEATWHQCQYSVEFRPYFAFYCPHKCGFCNINGCLDYVPTCSKDPSICTSPAMKDFSEKYCAHTCRKCSQCPDISTDCYQLKSQGFCSNYPDSIVKNYCGGTCGLHC